MSSAPEEEERESRREESKGRRRRKVNSSRTIEKKEIGMKVSLIEAVSKRPLIWDKRLPSFRKERTTVDTLWTEISNELGIKKELCKRTWKNLVDHFRTVYYDVIIRQKNEGISLEQSMRIVRWTYFDSMIFLKDNIQRRLSFAELKDFDEDADLENNFSSSPSVSQPAIEYQQESFMCEDNDAIGSSSLDFEEDGFEDEEGEEMDVKPNIPQQSAKRKHSEGEDVAQFSEITSHQTESKETAIEDKFCQYLLELLHEVPSHLRRKCRNMILDVTNTFADGHIPTILKQECD